MLRKSLLLMCKIKMDVINIHMLVLQYLIWIPTYSSSIASIGWQQHRQWRNNNNIHVVHNKDTVQSKREISRSAPRNPIIELHLLRNDIRQHLYFSNPSKSYRLSSIIQENPRYVHYDWVVLYMHMMKPPETSTGVAMTLLHSSCLVVRKIPNPSTPMERT